MLEQYQALILGSIAVSLFILGVLFGVMYMKGMDYDDHLGFS